MERLKDLKYILTAAVFSLIFIQHLAAQSIEASISADTNQMLIGDQVNVTLRVEHDPEISLEWPEIVDSLGGFEILERSGIQEENLEEQKVNIQQQTFLLTRFDSGEFRIPALDIYYQVGSDTSRKATFTNAFPITVHTVAVDTTADIKPIKEIREEPLTLNEILPYAIAGFVILAIAIFTVWYVRRRPKKEPEVIVKPKPQIPAHEIAMRKLAQLEEKRLWQKDMVKEYYSELTEVLREYMEVRFDIMALESTTDEIVRDLTHQSDIRPIHLEKNRKPPFNGGPGQVRQIQTGSDRSSECHGNRKGFCQGYH